jgi:predicted lactoylglutathione lyase
MKITKMSNFMSNENKLTLNFVVSDAIAAMEFYENPEYSCSPPKQGEVDSIWLQIIVDDVDATLKKAVENGAVVCQEPAEFMGTRHAEITDPFGYTWTINRIIREISFEERYAFYVNMQKERDMVNGIITDGIRTQA